MGRVCDQCKGPLPTGVRVDARFCSDACRYRARYRRRLGLPADAPLGHDLRIAAAREQGRRAGRVEAERELRTVLELEKISETLARLVVRHGGAWVRDQVQRRLEELVEEFSTPTLDDEEGLV